MFSSQANPAAVSPAYTRQSVSVLSSARRRPVIISSRNSPLKASSTMGAPMAIVAKLAVASAPAAAGLDPGSAESMTCSITIEPTTATDDPQRKASTSSRGGSGSQRSSHR